MEEAKIQPAAVTSRKLPKEFQYYFIFMGPAILLFSSLFVIPFFGEIYYSFTNWNGIDQTYGMVGINNYFRTFQDKGYWKSVWFTIRFSALSVLFSNHPIQKFLEGCHFPPAYHRRCGIGIFMEIHLSECICAVWTGHRAFLVFPKLVYDSGVVLYRSGHRIYLDALRLSDADLQCGLCLNTRRFTGGGDRRRGVTAAGA